MVGIASQSCEVFPYSRVAIPIATMSAKVFKPRSLFAICVESVCSSLIDALQITAPLNFPSLLKELNGETLNRCG